MVCLKRNRGRLSVFLTIKLSAGGERHAVRHICKTKRNSVIHYWLHQIWLNLFDEEGNYPPPRTLALAVKVLFAVCCWLKGSAIHRHQRGHMHHCHRSEVSLQVVGCRWQRGLWLKLLAFFSRRICHSAAAHTTRGPGWQATGYDFQLRYIRHRLFVGIVERGERLALLGRLQDRY